MKVREVGRLLSGACAVYGIAAACSGAEQAGRGTEAGAGGMGGRSTVVDAMLEAVASPVPEAEAQAPAGPTVQTSACDKTFPSGGATQIYAEFLFPGRTAFDIVAARGFIDYGPTAGAFGSLKPEGFRPLALVAWAKDGVGAVPCAHHDATVTLSLP